MREKCQVAIRILRVQGGDKFLGDSKVTCGEELVEQ